MSPDDDDSRLSRPGSLSATQAEGLDRACDRFEALWRSGGRPDLSAHLAGTIGAERAALARELVAIDVHWRRRAGERPGLDDYLVGLPGDAEAVRTAFDGLDPAVTDHSGIPAEQRPGSDPAGSDDTSLMHPSAPIEPEGPAAFTLPSGDGGDRTRVSVPGYEILGVLGRGGMGVVYKARQIGLTRIVALKMILAGAHAGAAERERFRWEGEAVARLQHPNIVQIYEVGEHDGLAYFSLEYCDGGTLADRLSGSPMNPKEAAQTAEVLARAVRAAHQAGLVHRDLKPANVLISGEGTLKITDFGLAKNLALAGQTLSGTVFGSPSYMSPEQASGHPGHVGPAADIYSLGAILYECLTGLPPFRGATVLDTLELVRQSDPLPPTRLQPSVPRDLEVICLKCLQKDPARRYAGAIELAEDLARFQAGEPIRARPVGWPERTWRWGRRNPALAGSLAILAVALVVGTAVSSVLAIAARAEARRARQSELRVAEAGRKALAQLVDASAASGLSAARREDHAQALLWFTHAVRLASSDPERDRLNRIRVRNWDRRVLQPDRRFTLQEFRSQQDHILAFQFHASGRYLIVLTTTGLGTLWDLNNGAIVSIPDGPERLSAAAFSADGRRFAFGTPEGRVEIREFPALQPLARWDTERGRVTTLAFRDCPIRQQKGVGRRRRCMRIHHYPSDVTDEQWALIEPQLPPAPPGGRPRKTAMRDVVDAIFYILRTGCQWRYLPADLPPRSTTWRYFDRWRRDGTLDTLHDLLRRKVRAAEKPYHPRTSASVDSQSVDTTSGGEQRGRDNAKNVDGRKRHIVVDSMGLLLAVLVTAADVDDAKAAAELFARLEGQPMSKVVRMYADTKYHNFALYEWVAANAKYELTIVRRPAGSEGWVKLPIRWTVERTFAWLGRCRRLSKDREKSVLSSESFVKLAMIQLMLHRLQPDETDAEFHYREAA